MSNSGSNAATLPPSVASNVIEPAGNGTPPANVNGNVKPVPAANKPSNIPKYLQMMGVIDVESGVGFATGLALGKKNIGGVIVTILALSAVFGLEFWLRYNKSTRGWLLPAGIIALFVAGIVPYLAMSKGGKGKAKDETAYLPTVAASWSIVAVLFGLACARMSSLGNSAPSVAPADAIQGVILSLLYAGVTSSVGYATGTGAGKSVTTKLSSAMWGALVMFDLAGLARAPSA